MPALPDSGPLHNLISQARALLRSSWVATGLGITIGLLLGTLAVLAVLDLFLPFEPITLPFVRVVVPLDPIFRTVALVLVTVPALLALFHGVVRPLWRGLNNIQVARRIEDQLPGIHNRLVSAIDLEDKAGKENVSQTFLARLITEALERIRGFNPSSLLDLVSLQRALIVAGVAVAASGVAWGVFSNRLLVAVERFLNPFADIPPASGVAYDVKPGDAHILREEQLRFTATVTQGETDKLRLVVYGPTGTEPKTFKLEPDKQDGRVFHASVDAPSLGAAFREGLTYRVYGGGTWSKLKKIHFVERPVVASTTAYTLLPKYARVTKATRVPDQALVTGFEDGKVRVRVQARGDVGSGEVQLLRPAIRKLPPETQEEVVWFKDETPSGSSVGVDWSWQELYKRRVHTDPAGPGTHGHWFRDDPRGITARKGDVLFAYVYLPEGQAPKMLALEWHDGEGWEHRAYWGLNKLLDGSDGSSSRFRVGAVPEAGQWVRLEVPARSVGLEGKRVSGMAFKVHDGGALWGLAGTVRVEAESVEVAQRYPLTGKEGNVWEGEFPLVGSGKFRVELKSPEEVGGYPCTPQKEWNFRAHPDLPPVGSVNFQADGGKSIEVRLAKPRALPLSIDAGDDVGVDLIRVRTCPLGGKWSSREVYSAKDKPLNTVHLTAKLDEAAKLKMGDALRFQVEVQDTKGQKTSTDEYTVRIVDDATSLDRKSDALDKQQDTFLEKLAKLLGEQKKISERLAELERQHAKLDAKIAELRDEGKRPDGKPLDDKTPVDPAKDNGGLTPEELKKLAELQREFAKLGGEQDRNTATAEALKNELKNLADESAKNPLLPPEFADSLKDTSNLFDRVIADAMRGLAKKLKDDAAPNTGSPDVKGAKRDAGKLDSDLKGIKDRLEGNKDAKRDALKGDLARAMKALRDRIDAENAKAAARDVSKELAELKDLLDRLREQMKGARERKEGDEKPAPPKPTKPGRKGDLEKEIKGLLEKAKKLLKKGDKGDDPEFPEAPFEDEGKEKKVPPREKDSDEPLPGKKDMKDAKKDGEGKKGDGEKKDGEDDEKLFQPRLGGPREKTDPRYKGKERPDKKDSKKDGEKDGEKDGKKDGEKGDEEKGKEGSRDLDSAEKALGSDSKSLKDLLDALAKGSKGKGKEGKGEEGEGDDDLRAMADALRELMGSKGMKEARAMAKAAKALKGAMGKGPHQGSQPSPPTNRDRGNEDGGELAGRTTEGKLGDLSPELRAMILKMPPRQREDLLRGRRNEGPEAYRAFIRDYFQRLSKPKK